MFGDITERVLMEKEKVRLEAQNKYLQEEILSEHNFGEIVGSTPSLLNLLRQVEKIAGIDSTVLILGETGTGKELIARAIHDRSPRRGRALVKVNCGAISAGLVESELFGHVKGAFTGAIANRDGRFKLADGGTIFLDEVGELPLDTQVKLLRVLQEQEFEPTGSSRTTKVDVRVVAATNRDLAEMVRAGGFRADLFYRLSVVPLQVPPLRDRAADLPLLVTFFVQKCAKKLGKPIHSVSEDVMRRLANYSWPGNVRELQNVIERAVILSPGSSLVLADELSAPPTPTAPVSAAKSKTPETAVPFANVGALDEVERRHIESVLNQSQWKIEGERGAARILGVNPSTLRSRMQKLGIQRPK
jgi:transcriptional regulator with GAF, ATPase, and Fis domain